MMKISSALLLAFMLAGCGGHARGPYKPGAERRDVQRATALYQDAMTKAADNPAKAEELLREAISFDLYQGPAHNNLGVLLLDQGRLYDAAEEFEWARKLLPGNPEPRHNLALALDRGRKTTEAIEMAHAALEVAPGYLPTIQTLALMQVREGIADKSTIDHLDAIASRSPDARWREWALTQRLSLETRLHDR